MHHVFYRNHQKHCDIFIAQVIYMPRETSVGAIACADRSAMYEVHVIICRAAETPNGSPMYTRPDM